jgi:DNA-binding CsgD family transcriptional regulator
LEGEGGSVTRRIIYIHLPTKQRFRASECVALTDRDIEILTKMQRGLLVGHLQREIATELGYTWASSLRHELEKLMRRFGVVNKYQLINKAVRLGILKGRLVVRPTMQKQAANVETSELKSEYATSMRFLKGRSIDYRPGSGSAF